MDFQILVNGGPLDGALKIKGDLSAKASLVVQHKDGATAAGQKVSIGTSAPDFVSPVDGVLDSNGRFAFIVGPSFGRKGDLDVTVRVGTKAVKSKVVNVRFTD